MTEKEIEEELSRYAPSRMSNEVYNLDRIRALLDFLGNPQESLKVIHITGTSGKTSTTYYVRALLESAGMKTGLTASPHIETVRERVQVAGGPIDEKMFIRYFNEFYSTIFGFEPRPTYFEIMTAFTYWVFNKERVDYAVVEVGLGGRLDATNTISRSDKVCVINSIGYDHTDILGDTLAAIASEKAGIIQEGNVVFTVKQDDEARTVIEAAVAKRHATLTTVHPEIDSSSLVPSFQQHNFALAYATVQYVARRDNLVLPPDAADSITRVIVPGRFEVFSLGGKTILLDGAHNPQKIEALIGALQQRNMQPSVVVAAFTEAPEKKITECIRQLSSYAERTIYTTFTVDRDFTRRSISLDILSKLANSRDECIEEPVAALDKALSGDEHYVIVTGSLYLVSMLRPLLQQRAGF